MRPKSDTLQTIPSANNTFRAAKSRWTNCTQKQQLFNRMVKLCFLKNPYFHVCQVAHALGHLPREADDIPVSDGRRRVGRVHAVSHRRQRRVSLPVLLLLLLLLLLRHCSSSKAVAASSAAGASHTIDDAATGSQIGSKNHTKIIGC